MRREVGNDLSAGYEFVADAFKTVRIHDGRHHLAIDSERNEYARAFDERRPVLVAERMAELDARPQQQVWCDAGKRVDVNNHHIAQADRSDNGGARRFVPKQNVAVAQKRAAVERHGNFHAAARRLAKSILLSLPVIQREFIEVGVDETQLPGRVGDISDHRFDENHAS